MNQIFVGANTYNIFLPILSLIISSITVIFGLWCIWRTEKRLDLFMKILTLAIFLGGVRKALAILGFDQLASWKQILLYFEIINGSLTLLAFVEMARLISAVSKAKKK